MCACACACVPLPRLGSAGCSLSHSPSVSCRRNHASEDTTSASFSNRSLIYNLVETSVRVRTSIRVEPTVPAPTAVVGVETLGLSLCWATDSRAGGVGGLQGRGSMVVPHALPLFRVLSNCSLLISGRVHLL